MPAFAHSQGGPLTEQQVGIIVQGIRRQWAKPRGPQPTGPARLSSHSRRSGGAGAQPTSQPARNFLRMFVPAATAIAARGLRTPARCVITHWRNC